MACMGYRGMIYGLVIGLENGIMDNKMATASE